MNYILKKKFKSNDWWYWTGKIWTKNIGNAKTFKLKKFAERVSKNYQFCKIEKYNV